MNAHTVQHTVVMGHGLPDYRTVEATLESITMRIRSSDHRVHLGPCSAHVLAHVQLYCRERGLTVDQKPVEALLHCVDRLVVFMQGYDPADVALVDQLRKYGPAVYYYIQD